MKRMENLLRRPLRVLDSGEDASPEPAGSTAAPAPTALPPEDRWSLRHLVQDIAVEGDPLRDALLSAQEQRISELANVFTPSRPKFGGMHFSGRRTTRERLRQILFHQGAHVLLYGARGLGKTSLSNAITALGDEYGYLVVRLSCSSATPFEALARTVRRRLLQADIPHAEYDRDDVATQGLMDLFASANDHPVLFVLDDLDNIDDPDFRMMLLETLKGASDLGLSVRFLIVGVARDVESLFGRDVRLERSLVAVQLPHMSWDDLQTLIDSGMGSCGLMCPPDITATIRMVSRGLPFVAQCLCLNSALNAVSQSRTELNNWDLVHAVDRFVEETDPRIRNMYESVTRRETHLLMVDLMFCLSVAQQDRYGQIRIEDMVNVPVAATGRCLDRSTIMRGVEVLVSEFGVLEPRLDQRGDQRHALTTDLLRPYTLMRQGRAKGLIPMTQ